MVYQGGVHVKIHQSATCVCCRALLCPASIGNTWQCNPSTPSLGMPAILTGVSFPYERGMVRSVCSLTGRVCLVWEKKSRLGLRWWLSVGKERAWLLSPPSAGVTNSAIELGLHWVRSQYGVLPLPAPLKMEAVALQPTSPFSFSHLRSLHCWHISLHFFGQVYRCRS